MRNRNLFNLVVAVVFLAACQASAAIFDHFDDGMLDPAWEVTFQNATGWTYTESGTLLTVNDIGTIDSNATSNVYLRQSFSAPDNFFIKCRLLWDSESTSSTMQTLGVRAYNGDKIVTEAGYVDWWSGGNGGKFARIEYPLYAYDSGVSTLPPLGSAEVTLKRKNGAVSVLWNDEVILTGSSDSVVDKLEIFFLKENSGGNFGVLSVDYINAVPEPATILLFGIGSCCALSRRKRV